MSLVIKTILLDSFQPGYVFSSFLSFFFVSYCITRDPGERWSLLISHVTGKSQPFTIKVFACYGFGSDCSTGEGRSFLFLPYWDFWICNRCWICWTLANAFYPFVENFICFHSNFVNTANHTDWFSNIKLLQFLCCQDKSLFISLYSCGKSYDVSQSKHGGRKKIKPEK